MGEMFLDKIMVPHSHRQNQSCVALLSGVALLVATLSLASSAIADNKKNVLILNSYSQGYKWTDDETRGAIETLAPLKNDLKVYIEYMATKWVSDDQYYEQLHHLMKHKFRNIPFDLLISMDNDALAFLVRYRDDIFGKVPTVFCGVNDFTDDDLKGQPLYTGINETADFKATLEVALKLHPLAKRVVFINDSSVTGRRAREEFRESVHSLQDRVQLEYLEDLAMPELLERVERLPDDSLILYTFFSRDKTGRVFEFDESLALIAQRAKVPIYGTWDFDLGHGSIGGMLTSGYEQGRVAGSVALRILSGESPESIPVIRKSPTRYMFDYEQMERYAIKRSDLPPDSIITNEPVSFYAVNKGLVWGAVASLVGLLFTLLVLLVNTHQRRRAEKSLRKAHDELETRVQQRTVKLVDEIAERRQVADALRASEQKLHRFIQGFSIPAFVIDRDHTILYWNRALEELSGLKAAAMTGTTEHWRAFYPEERPCMADLLVDERMASFPEWYAGFSSKSRLLDEAYEATDFFPDLGASGKWLRFTAAAIRNDKGELIAAIETLEDISDTKRSDEALRESRQQLSDIIDFLPDATFVIDGEGKVIAWNRAIEEMTGVKAVDMLGKGDYEYALPFYGARRPIIIDLVLKPDEQMERRYVSLERRGSVLTGETYIPALRGGKAYLRGTASALHDSRGRVVGAIQSIHDITGRRQAEEALTEAEEKYRGIFQNAIMGIYQTTPEGRFISANPALADILGYDSPEELMKTVIDLSRQVYVDPARRAELLRLVEERGTVREFEVQFYRKDGSIVWISLSLRTVRHNGGDLLYYEGTAQDITTRKLLEARLIQTQKIEAIGTLAGGIAHDFNNLLAAIIGYTEMAKRKFPQGELQRYLEQVLNASDRARDLVTQILLFSRRAEKEVKPIALDSLIQEALKLLRATLPTTIEIRPQIATGVDAILADPTQIYQILMNLCTNAAHAMREKGGLIEVTLGSEEIKQEMLAFYPDLKPGKYVKLTVRDTGTGIPSTIINRIFDPFFTTKKREEGTGLGLSVVYGIVKDYGGSITVQSEPGVGSTFIIHLPTIDRGIESPATPADALSEGSERVMFVDDQAILVEMGREMLEGLGYEVVVATSSAEALAIFRAQPARFGLVVTDMTMPGMTGKDLARELLQIRPDLPIILCTGFSELITEEEARRLGIREFLMKPLSLRTFAQVVRTVLDNSKTEQRD
jgi:two-component system, cell cycle sensor histidine kinase and response regulator CckA